MYHKKHCFNVLFFRGDNKSLVILCDPCKVYVIQYFICNSRNIFKWGLHVVTMYVGDSKLSFFHRFFFLKTLNQQRIYFYVIVPFELKLKAGGLCT